MAGELVVAGRPIPGVRARRLADGRLRWHRPEQQPASRSSGGSRGSRVERHLVEACRDLLETPEVAADDDFFVAGGHSMLAARLVQRLGDEFDLDVPLRAVFEHPVLSGLAAELEAQFPQMDQVLAEVEQLADSEIASLVEELPTETSLEAESVTHLSGNEQPFWLMEQFAPGSAVNTLTLRIPGSGQLDVAALDYAVARVVDRHEILRTSYGADENMNALRRVHGDAPTRVVVHRSDASGAERLAQRESTTGFDIGRAPLMRCSVVFTGTERFEILLSFHHLVMDYWGVTRVLLPEVSALYRERVAGVAAQLDPPAGYRQAILRDAAWQDSVPARAELAYWRERLRGIRPAEFRPDHSDPGAVDFRGIAAIAEADPGLVEQVDRYVSRNRTTLFAVVAAAVAATAHAWTSSEDVSFMSPAENRRNEVDARTMGTFVNLVTLRFRLDQGITWDRLVEQSRLVSLDAYAHQSVPISAALASVGEHNVIASGQGNYLVLNVFSDRTGLDLTGCQIDGGQIVPHDCASADLELSVMQATGRINLTMKYRPSRWEAGTVERILTDLLDTLARVVVDGDATVELPTSRRAVA